MSSGVFRPPSWQPYRQNQATRALGTLTAPSAAQTITMQAASLTLGGTNLTLDVPLLPSDIYRVLQPVEFY